MAILHVICVLLFMNIPGKNCANVYTWKYHRCVNVKSGKIVVLLKIFLNESTDDCVVNLSPNFISFSIQVNNDTVHMSYHFGCHRNHLGGNTCVTIVTKL